MATCIKCPFHTTAFSTLSRRSNFMRIEGNKLKQSESPLWGCCFCCSQFVPVEQYRGQIEPLSILRQPGFVAPYPWFIVPVFADFCLPNFQIFKRQVSSVDWYTASSKAMSSISFTVIVHNSSKIDAIWQEKQYSLAD